MLGTGRPDLCVLGLRMFKRKESVCGTCYDRVGSSLGVITLAGDEYRDEFYNYVIFPCYTELLQQMAEHMTVDEFITFQKGWEPTPLQEAENRVVNLVQGMSLAQRETVY